MADAVSDGDARRALIERTIAAAVALSDAPAIPVGFGRRAMRLIREALPALVPRVVGDERQLVAAGDKG